MLHYNAALMIQIYSSNYVSALVMSDKEAKGKQQKIDDTTTFGGSKKNIVTT